MDDHGSANADLICDFSDREPSITFGDLSAELVEAGYSVVVYYSNNEGPSRSTLRILGTDDDDVSRDIITGNTAQVAFGNVGFLEEAGDLQGPTNFTVFTGLNDPGFTVSLTGANNNGISAIQIVPNLVEGEIPEPATLALLSLAACGLSGYIRRRRAA